MSKHIIATFALLFATACGNEPVEPLQQSVDALRELTAPYQNIAQARAAGYDIQITDCMSDLAGGMGFHFGNGTLIDERPEELRPEVVMYEPAANGDLKLVGIEYVVPFDKWTAPTPPALHGQSFSRNEMFQVWALHMWIWRDNPGGMFASWNPAVSCAHSSSAKL